MSQKDSGWWKEFYAAFRPIFGRIDQRTTNAQVKFIINKLNLHPGQKFLDCPCGIGRTAIPLAKAGIRVTGVDITESYLKELSLKAKKQNLKIDLHLADMRRINFDSQFDAAGNIWTSFGYFEKESDNLLVLKRIFKALKPGGRFLLHLINRDWIMVNLQESGWYYMGDIRVLESRTFDYSRSVIATRWTLMKDGQEQVFDTTIRLYSYHELLAMFRQVGFVDMEGYGSEKGEPITRLRHDLVVIGTKPVGRRK